MPARKVLSLLLFVPTSRNYTFEKRFNIWIIPKALKEQKKYIESHLSEELSAEKIASFVGYSVFHFCRVFKEETGKSLMSYVRDKRLEIAEEDLENGESTAEVAIKYGFETSSGFARAYARKYGERPTGKMHA